MSNPSLPPLTDDYLQAMYGPCAVGNYRRGELIAYRDGEVKHGTILWIRTHGDGVLYIVSDVTYDCVYVLEENVSGVVRELSPTR